jgi:hypothetical protein
LSDLKKAAAAPAVPTESASHFLTNVEGSGNRGSYAENTDAPLFVPCRGTSVEIQRLREASRYCWSQFGAADKRFQLACSRWSKNKTDEIECRLLRAAVEQKTNWKLMAEKADAELVEANNEFQRSFMRKNHNRRST